MHPITQRRYQRPFRPDQLTGLFAWYDCADAATLFTGTHANRLTSTTQVANSGDLVCRIEDKSGRGIHATCTSDGARGAWDVGTLNGRNGVALGEYTMPVVSTNPATWFIVHRWSGATTDTRLCSNVGVNQVGLGIHPTLSGGNLSFVREGVSWTNSGYSPGTTTGRIYRAYFSNPASTYWTWSGGVETQRQTISVVGSGGGGTNINFPGTIFELICYLRDLSMSQINRVHAYLSRKWGLP